jgi:hypothetical protein
LQIRENPLVLFDLSRVLVPGRLHFWRESVIAELFVLIFHPALEFLDT